eukprot:s5763_g6.t1
MLRLYNISQVHFPTGGQCQCLHTHDKPSAHDTNVPKRKPEGIVNNCHLEKPPIRLLTMLFYLASSAEGGQTAFPMAYAAPRPADPEDCSSWLQVPAKRGKAVLFYNLHADGRLDRSSNHAGCKVQAGEKWSANIWAWNSKNQEIMDPDLDDELSGGFQPGARYAFRIDILANPSVEGESSDWVLEFYGQQPLPDARGDGGVGGSCSHCGSN